MTRVRLKKVKAVSYKKIYKNLLKIEKQVSKTEKEKQAEIVRTREELSKYLTKSGELRKNISQKRLKEFNKIVEGYKELGFDKISNIEKEIKHRLDEKKNKKREKKFLKEGYVNTKEDSEAVTKLLQNEAVARLINKGYLNIYDLIDATEDDDFNITDLMITAEYIVSEMDHDTPSEIADLLDEDDTYTLMKDYSNNKATKFMTRDMFKEWLKDNFSKVKKNLNVDSYSNLTTKDFESAYKNFLEGNYNRYL